METENQMNANPFCAWVTAYHGQQTAEVSGEFVLSDYYGDIRRVLCVKARAHTDDEGFLQDRLQYEGVVHCSVLYITEDDRVQNAAFSLDFADSVAMAEPKEEHILTVCPAVVGVQCRVQSPRKLSLRVKMQTEVWVRCRECIAPIVEGEHTAAQEATLCYRNETIQTMDFRATAVRDLNVTQEVEIEAGQSPIGTLCAYDAEMRVEECRMGAEGLLCRGNVFLQCLYQLAGSEAQPRYQALTRTLPLQMTVEHPELWQDYSYRATPKLRTLQVNALENAYGERRILELSIDYDLQIEAAKNEAVQVAKDLYSVQYPHQSTETTLEVPTLVGVYHGNLTLNEGKKRSEIGAEAAQEVVLVSAVPRIEQIESDPAHAKVILEGEVLISALLSDGEDASFSDAVYTQPFRMELNGITGAERAEYRYDCRVLSASGRLDREQLYPNVELGVDVMVTALQDQTLIERVTMDCSAPLEQENAMVLCYPMSGETVWELAKQYHTTCADITAANHLTEADPLAGGVLWIPNAKKAKA